MSASEYEREALARQRAASRIVRSEANYWWRKNDPAGALLNNLMFVFVVAPIALVLKEFYALSVVVFAFIVPYGFFVRRLAVRAVRQHLERHPDKQQEFRQEGIISC